MLRALENFKEQWDIENLNPLLINHKQVKNWVRIHTLNGSKRLPDNDKELIAIIRRHNQALADLSTKDMSVMRINSVWTDSANEHGKSSDDKYWQTILENPEEEDPEFQSYRHLFIKKCQWSMGVFDDLLQKVATDQIAGVVFASENLDWLYFPYDGGADIVFSSSEAANNFKERHQDWLSPYAEGL